MTNVREVRIGPRLEESWLDGCFTAGDVIKSSGQDGAAVRAVLIDLCRRGILRGMIAADFNEEIVVEDILKMGTVIFRKA